MQLKYQYWHFPATLDEKTCDKIISLGKEKIQKEGNDAEIEDGGIEKDIRQSKVCWFNDQWLYDLLWPYLREANSNAGWNFDFDISESIQFTKYELNDFYDWHTDGGSDHNFIYNNDNTEVEMFYGKVRKLSMTVNLNNPDEYKGGDFKFNLGPTVEGKNTIITCEEIKPKGSIIVFPSFMFHTVTPVTRGERYSLVMWTLGKPFK